MSHDLAATKASQPAQLTEEIETLTTPVHEALRGVYWFSFTGCPLVYYGSSVDIAKRLKHHGQRCRSGRHEQKVQDAFDKYVTRPGGSMISGLAELVPGTDEAELLAREQFWIDSFRPFEDYVLNTARVAARPTTGCSSKPILPAPIVLMNRRELARFWGVSESSVGFVILPVTIFPRAQAVAV